MQGQAAGFRASHGFARIRHRCAAAVYRLQSGQPQVPPPSRQQLTQQGSPHPGQVIFPFSVISWKQDLQVYSGSSIVVSFPMVVSSFPASRNAIHPPIGRSSRLQRQYFLCVFHAVVVLGRTVNPGRCSPRGRAGRAGARRILPEAVNPQKPQGKSETLKSSAGKVLIRCPASILKCDPDY